MPRRERPKFRRPKPSSVKTRISLADHLRRAQGPGQKRLTSKGSGGSGSGRKRLKRTAQGTDWERCWRPQQRKKAVTRGLDFIFSLAQKRENFETFGNDIMQCFYDVGNLTGEPVRRRCLKYVEQLAQRWKHSVHKYGWKIGERPTPQEVLDCMVGIYQLERLGIRTATKNELLAFCALAPKGNTDGDRDADGNGTKRQYGYGPEDYFGWDPTQSGPTVSSTMMRDASLQEQGRLVSGKASVGRAAVSRFRSMSNALIYTYYAERVGVAHDVAAAPKSARGLLGVRYHEVLRWLDEFRPYKGWHEHELGWGDYIDQCYLITHVLYTLNNWGELQLDPALFPHEYFFVRQHLDVHVRRRDAHLVGEFVEVLRCFGCTDADPLLRYGMATLMAWQDPADGSWDRIAGATGEAKAREIIVSASGAGGDENSDMLLIGERVDARWDGKDRWYRGEVTVCHGDGTFDILYDDGDREMGVPRALIRRPGKGEGVENDAYTVYHATMVAVQGLISNDTPRGFGPGFATVMPDILRWHATERRAALGARQLRHDREHAVLDEDKAVDAVLVTNPDQLRALDLAHLGSLRERMQRSGIAVKDKFRTFAAQSGAAPAAKASSAHSVKKTARPSTSQVAPQPLAGRAKELFRSLSALLQQQQEPSARPQPAVVTAGLAALKELMQMRVTYKVACELGRPVRKLRKHKNSEVAAVAGSLFTKWKSQAEDEKRQKKQKRRAAS